MTTESRLRFVSEGTFKTELEALYDYLALLVSVTFPLLTNQTRNTTVNRKRSKY